MRGPRRGPFARRLFARARTPLVNHAHTRTRTRTRTHTSFWGCNPRPPRVPRPQGGECECNGHVKYGTATQWTGKQAVETKTGKVQCSHGTIGRFPQALGLWWGGIVGWVGAECHCYGEGVEVARVSATPTVLATTPPTTALALDSPADGGEAAPQMPGVCQFRPMGVCDAGGARAASGPPPCCGGLSCTNGIIVGVPVCVVDAPAPGTCFDESGACSNNAHCCSSNCNPATWTCAAGPVDDDGGAVALLPGGDLDSGRAATCNETLANDGEFIDEQGLMCADWAGLNCTRYMALSGYSVDGVAEVHRACKRSCSGCGVPSYFGDGGVVDDGRGSSSSAGAIGGYEVSVHPQWCPEAALEHFAGAGIAKYSKWVPYTLQRHAGVDTDEACGAFCLDAGLDCHGFLVRNDTRDCVLLSTAFTPREQGTAVRWVGRTRNIYCHRDETLAITDNPAIVYQQLRADSGAATETTLMLGLYTRIVPQRDDDFILKVSFGNRDVMYAATEIALNNPGQHHVVNMTLPAGLPAGDTYKINCFIASASTPKKAFAVLSRTVFGIDVRAAAAVTTATTSATGQARKTCVSVVEGFGEPIPGRVSLDHGYSKPLVSRSSECGDYCLGEQECRAYVKSSCA